MLKIEHIFKTFNAGTVNEKRAISDLCLTLEDGDFATIVGSNGAGKSTLVRCINLLERPTPAISNSTGRTSPSFRSMSAAAISDASFRIR